MLSGLGFKPHIVCLMLMAAYLESLSHLQARISSLSLLYTQQRLIIWNRKIIEAESIYSILTAEQERVLLVEFYQLLMSPRSNWAAIACNIFIKA